MTNQKEYSIRDALFEAPGPKTKRTIRFLTVLSMVGLAYILYWILHQFFVAGQLQTKYWSFYLKITTWQFIGKGLLSTLGAALGAMVVSFALAMLLMLGRICDHRPIAWLATAVIEITRGIPTLLFIYFFLLVPSKLGLRLDAYWKLTLPVAISACGVVAEVLRSGVNSVPKGQREAALSLGMQSSHVFAKIIFPQAFRYVVPSLIAELVIVLKDTTFAYVVNYADLMQNAKVLISNYDALVSVYFVIAVIYILINYILNRISERISRRMNLSVKVK
jgi:glutamate transport system permease protein